jgi:hypothetical protein
MYVANTLPGLSVLSLLSRWAQAVLRLKCICKVPVPIFGRSTKYYDLAISWFYSVSAGEYQVSIRLNPVQFTLNKHSDLLTDSAEVK